MHQRKSFFPLMQLWQIIFVVFISATGSMCHAQKEVVPGARKFVFPEDQSVGLLTVSDWSSQEGREYGDEIVAKGTIEIPAGKYVYLQYEIADMSYLRQMAPDGIQMLELSWAIEDFDEAEMRALEGLTGLQELRIGMVLEGSGLQYIQGMTQLRRLELDSPYLVSGFEYLRNLPALEELVLPGTLGNKSLATLKNLPALKKINLAERVTDEGLVHLSGFPALEEINGWQNLGVKGQGLAHLKECKSLRRLEFRSCGLDRNQLAGLAEVTQLEELALSPYESLRDRNLVILKHMTRLRRLDVSFNRELTGTGFAQIAPMNSLEELNVSYCQVADAGLAEIVRCKGIKSLDLTYSSDITDQGMVYLSELKELQKLILSSSRISPEGLKRVAQFPKLEYLEIQQPIMNDERLEIFMAMKSLKEFKIGRSQVTAGGIEKFKLALPNCRVEWTPPRPEGEKDY